MDQEINKRIGKLSSSNSSTCDEIAAKMECPSHVINVKCDGFVGRVCRICHLNAKESGDDLIDLWGGSWELLICFAPRPGLNLEEIDCVRYAVRLQKNVTGVGDVRFMEECLSRRKQKVLQWPAIM